MPNQSSVSRGREIKIEELSFEEINQGPGSLEQLINSDYDGLIIRRVFSKELMERACDVLQSPQIREQLCSPNQGMPGGELLTLGVAATPTFTALNGPDITAYLQSATKAPEWEETLFGDGLVTQRIQRVFSALNHNKPAHPAPFECSDGESKLVDDTWLPFNYRIFHPGVQIYSHHDNHYRLPIYEHLSSDYDREMIFSWFVTAQKPDEGGVLTMYGVSGDDPDVPRLPTRFVDTATLEREYHKSTLELFAGDLLIFNSKANIHRVTAVEGGSPRVTFGGFLTTNQSRSETIFWS